ncbi:hypothetical protein Fmac_032928 [Flemingia macrophylla]|uniref:Uncharacterized protein n=1 Tax=Flemingia macrophylla TaxID=520843 RepID=A0ABD1L6B7_9FABA
MSILRLMLQTHITNHHSSIDKALDREDGSQLLELEGNLDALVNLVTQLAANQKPGIVARVCGICSSNDHHTSFSARNDAIVIRGVHDVATDTSAETRNLEGKLDALVNLVTKLVSNNKPTSIARVCDIRSSNDHHTNTSAKTRKLEGKLDALVNLVTHVAVTQKSVSGARVCGIRSSNDHHTSVCPSSQQSGVDNHPEAYFSARKDAIVIRGVHDVAIVTSTETRKLTGKLDALVNLVTQLAANQKPASIARVYDICSSNNHHTSVCPSLQQSGVYELPEAYAANTYSIPPQQGVHDVATDTSAETRKREGNLDAFVNLVTQLAANQRPASKAKVRGICSSSDHHTRLCPSSQQSGFSSRNDAIVVRGFHDVATDTSAETRKLEGKLDVLVNLVTKLVSNNKPTFIARVCGIRSCNDHHTSVCPSSQQSGVDEHPEAHAANTYSRPQ